MHCTGVTKLAGITQMSERVQLEGINTNKCSNGRAKSKNVSKKAPDLHLLAISRQVYGEGCLKGVEEVNLMDLTVKREQSWDRKAL